MEISFKDDKSTNPSWRKKIYHGILIILEQENLEHKNGRIIAGIKVLEPFM